MAKRPPTSRSQADDMAAGPAPKPPRARAAKASAPIPPGAPVPPDTQGARGAASTSMASEPSEQDIRMRAYHRYLERGGGQGQEFEDWVEAERELKTRR